MDYFLNEYSIRGQFKDVDDFYKSLRDNMLPILDKIAKQDGDVIWKKDTFWSLEICNGITLSTIPSKKNERSSELLAMKNKLIKLLCEKPFWGSDSKCNLKIKEYKFDLKNRDNFEEPNCFSQALESEGRIVSFAHPAYNVSHLPIIVSYNNSDKECKLDNIYSSDWWKSEPTIRTWRVMDRYVIEIRAKEFEYHPPHFHVSSNEYAAVFKLSNGELYTYGNKKWPSQMITEIQKWYKTNKEDLQTALEVLHNS